MDQVIGSSLLLPPVRVSANVMQFDCDCDKDSHGDRFCAGSSSDPRPLSATPVPVMVTPA